ncbi:MAG: 2-oxoacid:acceptor oxidoreductase subunit alpha, partial [Planctomycetota bacterium]
LETLTRKALEESPLDTRSKDRCKNMFALGILYWLFHRDMQPTFDFIRTKFAKKPDIAEANVTAVEAGYRFADVSGIFQANYKIAKATDLAAGTYRNIMGNQSLCLGLVAASKKAEVGLMLGSYPITPASDILHQLSTYKHHGVVTFQAEDEIAAVCAAIGASYSGKLGITSTSGPGLALKSEAIGLAVMTELPLVVIDVQRAGPSTGMPTKTEQSDLLQAMFGRNGECPVAIVCARTPADAFEAAYESVRIALQHMVPVILLSDGYVANGSEPWRVPDVKTLRSIEVAFAKESTDGEKFQPYARDPKTLARNWAIPGTPGLQHRIGGLEKSDGSGNISYDPDNHQHMTNVRAEKVARIADSLPPTEVMGAQNGDVLVLGWGGTCGAIQAALREIQNEGHGDRVGAVSLRYISPFPKDLGDILSRFKTVLIPEWNSGQLAMLIRAKYLIDAQSIAKVQGQPFSTDELVDPIREALGA